MIVKRFEVLYVYASENSVEAAESELMLEIGDTHTVLHS